MATASLHIPNGPVGVSILGSTGSIGVNTLDVIARHADRYRVVALTANSQVDRLIEQCQRFDPELVVLMDEASAELAEQKLSSTGLRARVLSGVEGLETAASLPQVDQSG